MNRIGIYLRVSTEEQAKIIDGSLVSQKQRLIEYIAVQNQREQNWGTLIDVYCDEGKSAKDMNRPEFQRLLEDVRLGRINLILATELSRFSRSIRDFCELWDLFKKHNTRFITLREQFDTTTAAGEMMVFNLINFAQFERKQTAERITANCLSRAKRGLWNGGRLPLGYERSKENKGVLILNKEEVKKVKAIFKIFIETGSLRKTCLKLSENAIFSKDGNHFTLSRLYNLLTNPAYVGFRAVGRKTAKTELFKATWEGIIDNKTFEKTQKILEANKSKYKPDEWKTYPYPLTEKIVCGECGKTMGGKSAYGKHRKHHYYEHTRKIKKDGVYHTKRCRIERVRAERIEKIILDYLKELLSNPKKINEMVGAYSKHMNAEIPGLKGKIKTIQHDLRITQNKIENLIQRLSEIPKEVSAEPIYRQLKTLNDKEIILKDNLQNLELELTKASTKAIDIATLRNQIQQAVEAINKAPIENQRPIFANIINFAEVYPQKIRLGLYAPLSESLGMRTGSCTVRISARRIVSVITPENKNQWIEKAANLSQKELEFEVVKINPRPTTKEIIKPVQEDRAELKMGISKKLESNLRKVQDILSQKKKTHVTLEQAMEFITDMFLEHEDPVRKAQRLCSNTVEKKNRDRKVEVSRKAATMGRLAPSLHCSAMSGTTKTKRLPIPANIKHQVVLRDKNQCTHNHHGRRCEMQRWIQLHHIKPVSQGGLNTVANLKTLCFYHHREAHR